VKINLRINKQQRSDFHQKSRRRRLRLLVRRTILLRTIFSRTVFYRATAAAFWPLISAWLIAAWLIAAHFLLMSLQFLLGHRSILVGISR
jgi:hypothetical protein